MYDCFEKNDTFSAAPPPSLKKEDATSARSFASISVAGDLKLSFEDILLPLSSVAPVPSVVLLASERRTCESVVS